MNYSSVPNRSAGPNKSADGRFPKITKRAVGNKRAGETSCKKLLNGQDLIDVQ